MRCIRSRANRPRAEQYQYSVTWVKYAYCQLPIPCYRPGMVSARCYECPSCGGLVRETSRLCNYCGSPIATVRCGRCFMMNVTEALHCIGCGSELGLMPIQHEGSVRWNCPRCQDGRLDAFESTDGILHDCRRCGGQFVSHPVLQQLVARYQASSAPFNQRLRQQNPLLDKITYLPCPNCRELMLRRNFGRISGIVVDVCARHGTWFDVGELPRILAFVTQGGIEAGRVVIEEERRVLSKMPVRRLAPAVPGRPISESAISLADMRDAARAFALWVADILRS